MNDFFSDSLDDLLGGPAAPAPKALPQAPEYVRIRETVPTFTETCPSCKGTGRFRTWSGRDGGSCFKCDGKGSKTYKSSPQERAANRAAYKAQPQKNWDKWAEANQQEAAWVLSEMDHFEFAAKMYEAVKKFGDLTQGQMDAVRKGVVRQANWAADKAKTVEQKAAEAPAANVDALVTAFRTAKAHGLKYPKLRTDNMILSLAPDHGANAGAVYVKTRNDEYLGKVMNGKYFATGSATDEQKAMVAKIVLDPKAAAAEYGKTMGVCMCCGRQLTDPVSVANGIGPDCADHFGF